MARTNIILGVCCITALAAGIAIGQPGSDKGKDMPKGMPQMSEEEMKAMKAWEESATPGKMHDWMVEGCGVWDGKVKMWMAPNAPASESTCVTTITPMMGNRFTKAEVKGEMDFGGQKMPFEGFGIWGYNNTTQKFESTWVDNCGTMQLRCNGTLSSDMKVLTLQSEKFTCPMKGKDCWMREVHTRTGADTATLAMYGPGDDGKEFKVMEITYTRKPGTAPVPMKKSAGH